eukprot:EG_transcript_26714
MQLLKDLHLPIWRRQGIGLCFSHSYRDIQFRMMRTRRPKGISKGKGKPNVDVSDEGSIPMLIPCHIAQWTESSELNTCFALDKFISSAAGAKAKHHDIEDVFAKWVKARRSGISL